MAEQLFTALNVKDDLQNSPLHPLQSQLLFTLRNKKGGRIYRAAFFIYRFVRLCFGNAHLESSIYLGMNLDNGCKVADLLDRLSQNNLLPVNFKA